MICFYLWFWDENGIYRFEVDYLIQGIIDWDFIHEFKITQVQAIGGWILYT